MCGIFGFVGHQGKHVNFSRLKEIARKTEERGPHAFGFAWIDGRGRLRAYKHSGRISQRLDTLAMAADARMLVGHTRFATQGSPENNLNNHPHPCDGGWIVHNGMIRQYRQLVIEQDLFPVSQCDSEVLGLLVEQLDGTLPERCAEACRIAGDSNLALLGLWRAPDRLVAVRAGNPLHVGHDASGFYLGSYAQHLPSAREVPDDSVLSFRVVGDEARCVTRQLELA